MAGPLLGDLKEAIDFEDDILLHHLSVYDEARKVRSFDPLKIAFPLIS